MLDCLFLLVIVLKGADRCVLLFRLLGAQTGSVRLTRTGLTTTETLSISGGTKLPPLGEGGVAVPFEILS